ncbi:iron-sulfur cluster repair di-iron protein [Geofilum sp. OHC36d9]|uniref:iron-sulfur cluster repair di-iron protein n=1 Tax=Geofilum sp. OHC36d9 TaxID=3458413 RepID=UPI00403462BC
MEITNEQTVGGLVAFNFKTADVFSRHGIDFCCGGDISLASAAQQNNIAVADLVEELQQVIHARDVESDLIGRLSLDALVDYIIENHHQYIRENVKIIPPYLNKLVEVHGRNHPELKEVNELFSGAVSDLSNHIVKEELVLFPYIKVLVEAMQNGVPVEDPGFGTVESPVMAMMAEHDAEGERFRTISKLTNGYTLPPDGCNTFRVGLEKLKEFETDLHRHIHLENNILFPKAIELEKKLINSRI